MAKHLEDYYKHAKITAIASGIGAALCWAGGLSVQQQIMNDANSAIASSYYSSSKPYTSSLTPDYSMAYVLYALAAVLVLVCTIALIAAIASSVLRAYQADNEEAEKAKAQPESAEEKN